MKKKFITLTMMIGLFFMLASCDFLSSLIAAKGLYDEYQEYSTIYEEATQYTILNEMDLSVVETNIDDMEEVHSRLYMMLDKDSTFLYVEQTLDDEEKTSVYEDAVDLYVEYLIDELVVLPTEPIAEDRFDSNTNVNILNDSFTYEDVENENKTATHTYEFDLYLNKAINLDELSVFVDQLALFGGDSSSFDNAYAHVILTFNSNQSEIDVQVTVDDYRIDFEAEQYVIVDLSTHSVFMIPDDFEMPNVFADPYQMIAVDDKDLARRVYNVDSEIVYPAIDGENGWVQLYLEAGDYQVDSLNFSNMILTIEDSSGNAVVPDLNWEFTVTEADNYYMYIVPGADFLMDITLIDLNPVVTTETTITTTTVTTIVDTSSTQAPA